MAIGTTAAILGSAALGAGSSIYGASKASSAQRRAAEMAIAQQRQMLEQARSGLQPYMSLGEYAGAQLQDQLPYLTTPIGLDQEFLESTPGYQFAKEQGQRAIDAALAKAGLARSGAAVKEAGRFGTGLADQTYGQQFERERLNRADIYNRLFGTAELGRGAAGALAGAAIPTGANIGQATIGAGNAQGAAYTSAANAVGQAGQNALSYWMLNKYLQPQAAQAGMYSTPWTTTVNYPSGG